MPPPSSNSEQRGLAGAVQVYARDVTRSPGSGRAGLAATAGLSQAAVHTDAEETDLEDEPASSSLIASAPAQAVLPGVRLDTRQQTQNPETTEHDSDR